MVSWTLMSVVVAVLIENFTLASYRDQDLARKAKCAAPPHTHTTTLPSRQPAPPIPSRAPSAP